MYQLIHLNFYVSIKSPRIRQYYYSKSEISVGKLPYDKVMNQKFVRHGPQVNTTEHSLTLSTSVDTEMNQNGVTS